MAALPLESQLAMPSARIVCSMRSTRRITTSSSLREYIYGFRQNFRLYFRTLPRVQELLNLYASAVHSLNSKCTWHIPLLSGPRFCALRIYRTGATCSAPAPNAGNADYWITGAFYCVASTYVKQVIIRRNNNIRSRDKGERNTPSTARFGAIIVPFDLTTRVYALT